MKVKKHNNHKKRILILSANPIGTSHLRLDEEVRDIEEGLHRSKHRDKFEVNQKMAIRLRDLRRALLDVEPHILHFTGHGEIEGILVEDKNGFATPIPPKALAGLVKLLAGRLECVILSACYSEYQAAAINKYIKYVIAMPQEIRDRAALEFAVGFYDALGAGKSVEEAHEFGCNAIQQACPDLPDFVYPRLQVNSRIKTKKKKKLLSPLIAALIFMAILMAVIQRNQTSYIPVTIDSPTQRAVHIDSIPERNVNTDIEPANPGNENLVYYTDGGHRYHRKYCRYVKNKTGVKMVTVSQAKALGRTPCKICNPPD